jgi:cobalamin biosynthesis Mg chelatase CobN
MVGRSLVSVLLLALLTAAPSAVSAAPKAKGKAAAPAKPKKGQPAEKDKPQEGEQKVDPASEEAAKKTSKEEDVKAAGTAAAKGPEAGNVKVKEDKEGVKTYKFETVEVEGRLKSPQVIYFLRRVRAEFEAGALGHRSFMGELSDSRRSAAFR